MPCVSYDPASGVCQDYGINVDTGLPDPTLCAVMTDPTFCQTQQVVGAGGNPNAIFPCTQDCINRNCGGAGAAVQCGIFSCSGTDPTLYKGCTDGCISQCGGTPAGPGPGPGGTAVPGSTCLGPLGLMGCTVSGIADDIARGGRIIGGAAQAATKNINVILLVLLGLVAVTVFKDVRAL